MATPYDDVYSIFLIKYKKYPEYFNYYNLFDDDALKERAKGFLVESIVKLKLYCTPDVDFMDKDDIYF